MELTQQLVRELFDYKDGKLYWKVKLNGRKMGKPAGGLHKIKHGNRWRIKISQVEYVASRLIFLWHYGWLPEVVDHEDHNTENDCIENLRSADISKNNKNCTSHKGSTSIYLGVHLNRGKYWVSKIKTPNGRKYIGSFSNEKQAALSYNREAVRYHKEFANLNIIQP